mmetsp:Transcript_4259/g.6257  ORF Transcript_4259/g.6257 Transcript_4259/m.6257 type:complete len:88 (+) Transcript_4259:199-462(+)
MVLPQAVRMFSGRNGDETYDTSSMSVTVELRMKPDFVVKTNFSPSNELCSSSVEYFGAFGAYTNESISSKIVLGNVLRNLTPNSDTW